MEVSMTTKMMNAWLVEDNSQTMSDAYFLLLASKEVAYLLTQARQEAIHEGTTYVDVLIPSDWVRLLTHLERHITYYPDVRHENPVGCLWHEDMPKQGDLYWKQVFGVFASVFPNGKVVLHVLRPEYQACEPIDLDHFRISAGLAPLDPESETTILLKTDHIKQGDMWVIDWHTVEGEARQDFFCTRATAKKYWGNVAGELSWVHIWDKPEEGVRHYLSHLPLHNVYVWVKVA
jgi:hypothetical protein